MTTEWTLIIQVFSICCYTNWDIPSPKQSITNNFSSVTAMANFLKLWFSKCSEWQCSKDKSWKNFFLLHCHFISCTICGFTPYFLLNMAGLCWCICHRPHTLSPTPCCYRQSPVQSWLAERVGGMRVKFWVLYQLLQPLLPRPLEQPVAARVGQMSGTGYHWGNWSNVPCPEGR